ncbi:MAG: hypothetical protein MHPSP_000800 [Paramarteilia canceri]
MEVRDSESLTMKCYSRVPNSSKIWHTPFAVNINVLNYDMLECMDDGENIISSSSLFNDQNQFIYKILNNSNNLYCIYLKNSFIANKTIAEKHCASFKSITFKDALNLNDFSGFSILNTNNGVFIFESTLPKIYAALRNFKCLLNSDFLTLNNYLSKMNDDEWFLEEFESAVRRLEYFGIKTKFDFRYLNPYQTEDLNLLNTFNSDDKNNTLHSLNTTNDDSRKYSIDSPNQISPDFYRKISLLDRDIVNQYGIDPNLNWITEDQLATYGSDVINALNTKYEELNISKKSSLFNQKDAKITQNSNGKSLSHEVKEKYKILRKKSTIESESINPGPYSLYIDENKLNELERIATSNVHTLNSSLSEFGPISERRCSKGIITQAGSNKKSNFHSQNNGYNMKSNPFKNISNKDINNYKQIVREKTMNDSMKPHLSLEIDDSDLSSQHSTVNEKTESVQEMSTKLSEHSSNDENEQKNILISKDPTNKDKETNSKSLKKSLKNIFKSRMSKTFKKSGEIKISNLEDFEYCEPDDKSSQKPRSTSLRKKTKRTISKLFVS